MVGDLSNDLQILQMWVCEYLKWLIDHTPRTKRDVMQMYLARLGQHFDFQIAQRMAIARIEEVCVQSDHPSD